MQTFVFRVSIKFVRSDCTPQEREGGRRGKAEKKGVPRQKRQTDKIKARGGGAKKLSDLFAYYVQSRAGK